MKKALLIITAAALAGCMKDELPVPKAPRGEARTMRTCMGPGYQQQLWISLASASVVRQNPISAWDLAFEGGPDGWRIVLNGGRLMLAWNTGATTIDASVEPSLVYLNGRFDAPSGNPDSTAVGDWRENTAMYVVDLGYDALGNPMGQRRIRPLAVNAAGYQIEVAMADGSGATVVSVAKDAQRAWVHYRFGPGVVDVAPPDGQWDMVLTRYTHYFEADVLPYLVVGALTDGGRTRVARLTGADFATVTLADTLAAPFSRRRDAIGYDWKEYSFESSAYTCDPRIVYIIEDDAGVYHKLHFLDYYGEDGQLGCPLFAFQTL